MNFLAIFLGVLAAYVFNAIWFGPKTFYPIWWKLSGNEPTTEPGGQSPLVLFGSTFLATLAQATTVAIFIEVATIVDPNFGPFQGLAAGALLGAGIAAASSLSHRLFSRAGFAVWIIEVGQDIVSLAVMGLIIAAWL